MRIALASVMPLGGRAICLIFRSASAIIRLTAFSLTRDWTIYLFFFCRSRILMPLFAAMQRIPFLRRKSISGFLCSCRAYKNWVKNNLTRLKMLHIWLQRHSDEYFAPFVIYLTENLSMALTLYSHIQNVPLLESFPVYFCPDSLLISSPTLDSIYSCEIEDDGHLTAIRHSISF